MPNPIRWWTRLGSTWRASLQKIRSRVPIRSARQQGSSCAVYWILRITRRRCLRSFCVRELHIHCSDMITQVYHFWCLACSQRRVQHSVETLEANARLEQLLFLSLRGMPQIKKFQEFASPFRFWTNVLFLPAQIWLQSNIRSHLAYWMPRIKLPLRKHEMSPLNFASRSHSRQKGFGGLCNWISKSMSPYRRSDITGSRFVHPHDALRVDFSCSFPWHLWLCDKAYIIGKCIVHQLSLISPRSMQIAKTFDRPLIFFISYFKISHIFSR